MKILLVTIALMLAVAVAAWTHLPKSDCLQNCCDNHACGAPAAPKP